MKLKLITKLLLTLMFISLSLNAQTKYEKKLDAITKNCIHSLKHENIGVVESAIYVSLKFKSRYPNENSKQFINALNYVANNSNSEKIIYKAKLAKIFFEKSDWFKGVDLKSVLDAKEVFEDIAIKLNDMMFLTDI